MHTHTTDRSTQTTKVDRHTSPSRKPCTYIKRQVQASPNNCVNMRVRACVCKWLSSMSTGRYTLQSCDNWPSNGSNDIHIISRRPPSTADATQWMVNTTEITALVHRSHKTRIVQPAVRIATGIKRITKRSGSIFRIPCSSSTAYQTMGFLDDTSPERAVAGLSPGWVDPDVDWLYTSISRPQPAGTRASTRSPPMTGRSERRPNDPMMIMFRVRTCDIPKEAQMC